MTIERTVKIPANRRIVLVVPEQIPAGSEAGIRFSWPPQIIPADSRTRPEQNTESETLPVQTAENVQKRGKRISAYFNILSPETFGSGVVFQRKLRDEWNE